MKHLPDSRATSLVEILIAIIVLSLVMFGIYNIQLFSDSQVVGASRRANMQNEALYVLEHMSKSLQKAVSNGRTYPVAINGDAILIWNDKSPYDGRLQDHLDASPDTLVYYSHASTGVVSFCPNASTSGYPGTVACNVATETVSTHVTSAFSSSAVINTATNYVGLEVTACWDPASSSTCGKMKNPSSFLKTRVDMPSVSTLP